MKKILVILLMLYGNAKAQPYLDLGQITYHNTPFGQPDRYEHLRAQVNVPLMLKDSSVILVNPIWDQRWLEDGYQVQLRGFATWITYNPRFGIRRKWEGTFAFIPRFNGEPSVQFNDGFQAGGAALITYHKSSRFSAKAGLYYNREFFGNFFMPLIGFDWKINKEQRLFGILPGYATYENRVSRTLSWGGNWRTFTNSYKLAGGSGDQFIRVDDNQLGAYLDYYFTKNIVATAEMGHTIMRKVRSGQTKSGRYIKLPTDDAPYFRITLQYRLRFDQKN